MRRIEKHSHPISSVHEAGCRKCARLLELEGALYDLVDEPRFVQLLERRVGRDARRRNKQALACRKQLGQSERNRPEHLGIRHHVQRDVGNLHPRFG